MKLLLENWRQFLNERETDDVYADVVNFLAEAFTTRKNYEYVSEEEADEFLPWRKDPETLERIRKMMQDLTEADEEEDEVVDDYDFMLNEPRIEDLYKQLTQKVPDVATLLDSETFFYMLHGLYLSITYNKKRETIIGWFNSHEPEVVLNFASALFEPQLSLEAFQKLTEKDIFSLLRTNFGLMKEVLDHEFTHMINFARAGTQKRAKGLGRHHRRKSIEKQKILRYINSTEEIQARMIPIFNLVNIAIEQGAPYDTPANKTANLIKLEIINNKGNESIRNIVEYLLKIYEIHHPAYLEFTSQSNKKRIINRFYDFAKRKIQGEENEITT